jgi:hypothetical protein
LWKTSFSKYFILAQIKGARTIGDLNTFKNFTARELIYIFGRTLTTSAPITESAYEYRSLPFHRRMSSTHANVVINVNKIYRFEFFINYIYLYIEIFTVNKVVYTHVLRTT